MEFPCRDFSGFSGLWYRKFSTDQVAEDCIAALCSKFQHEAYTKRTNRRDCTGTASCSRLLLWCARSSREALSDAYFPETRHLSQFTISFKRPLWGAVTTF